MDKFAIIRDIQHRIALYEDMKAYNELYDLLFEDLHRFAYAFVKSNETAEEIVSDVFIKLWQIRDRLTGIDNLKVYLYTITRNFSLTYITRNYKIISISLDSIDLNTVVEISDPEQLCISSDTIRQIQEAINQLPPQCRLIFQMVKDDGLKYKEVAAILNLSSLTVRNQVAIATQKILERLPEHLLPAIRLSTRFSNS